MVRSWRLKLARAEEHFGDLEELIRPLRERRAYPVSERVECEDDAEVRVWRVNFAEPDEAFVQILVGELMFNARSALDHIACAMVPSDRRTRQVMRATQFPIFTSDIDELDPTTGKYAHPNERGNWQRMTQGLPDDAIPLLKGLQPYMFRPEKGPDNHAFAILHAFQNADKHRGLVIVASGLTDPVVRHVRPSGLITYESAPYGLAADRVLRNGAAVHRAPADEASDMKVEVEATMQILIGEGDDPWRPFPDIFEATFRTIRQAFDLLEPLVNDA
jgi:hypothetical protein